MQSALSPQSRFPDAVDAPERPAQRWLSDKLRPGNLRLRLPAFKLIWLAGAGLLALLALSLASAIRNRPAAGASLWQTGEFQAAAMLVGLTLLAFGTRFIETRRYRQRLVALARKAARNAERARIARDMHDRLGADLTRIKLLGELVERDLASPELAASHARRISQTARDLARAMDEVVWAVNPEKDRLRNLVSYLGSFTEEFLGATALRCRLDLPASVPELPVSAELRHHLFLAVKEALHNAVKHGAATEIRLRVALEAEELVICVEDNGRGFAPGSVTGEGNGLKNLRQRLAEVRGTCRVDSRPGAGTRVRLAAPLQEF